MGRQKNSKIAISSSPDWCSICGFVIPKEIVNKHHNLVFTVDHKIPMSKGGQNTVSNRKASHRFCNMTKSDCININELTKQTLRMSVMILLESYYKRKLTKKEIMLANRHSCGLVTQ